MARKNGDASHRTRKIAAIAAGALVIGVGATYTLASWTDQEWVWGGNAAGDGGGIGTSTFEVEQFTEGSWHHDETNPGGALDFTAAALSMTPGDVVYAPVSLRTITGSIGGEVELQPAVAAAGISGATLDGPGVGLWKYIDVAVFTSADATAPDCAGATFDSADWSQIVATGTALGSEAATAAQPLGAATTSAPGAPQHYCFVLTLPANAQTEAAAVTPVADVIMGRTVAPAWLFDAESD